MNKSLVQKNVKKRRRIVLTLCRGKVNGIYLQAGFLGILACRCLAEENYEEKYTV